MAVILKQRTLKTAEGLACFEDDPEGAFLIGPKGAKVSAETAKALGLINGRVPTAADKKPTAKEREKAVVDKTGRRVVNTGGTPLTSTKLSNEAIKAEMNKMLDEAELGGIGVWNELLTTDGKPSVPILQERLDGDVSAKTRNNIFAEIEAEAEAKAAADAAVDDLDTETNHTSEADDDTDVDDDAG